MLKSLLVSRYIFQLGCIAIAICVCTWLLDLFEVVQTCPFCRTERTVIGLLGVLMVLPHYRYVTIFFTILFASIGLVVASQHLFLMIKTWHFSWNTPLVIAALCILSGELLVLIERTWLLRKSREKRS